MAVRRSSAFLRIVYVSLALIGSVLIGSTAQAQTNDPAAAAPAAQTQNAPSANSPAPSPAASAPAQATIQNQTPAPRNTQSRDEDSVPRSRPRFHVTSVVVGGGYTHFGRRSFGGPFLGLGFGYYPYGYYSPYYDPFYGPYYQPYGGFYGPAYPPAFYREPGYGRGEIKLSIDPKYAKIYIDGAFAGRAEDLKHIYLKPGTYTLSVQAQDRETYTEKLYVLSGKTLKIKTTLDAERLPSSEEKR
jgi:hypothetical protein